MHMILEGLSTGASTFRSETAWRFAARFAPRPIASIMHRASVSNTLSPSTSPTKTSRPLANLPSLNSDVVELAMWSPIRIERAWTPRVFPTHQTGSWRKILLEHLPYSSPHDLDLGLLSFIPKLGQSRHSRVSLGDPFLGELPGLDVLQDADHLLLHSVIDDHGTSRPSAVLSGVRDAVPHPFDAALLNEVDYELQLVKNLEVRDLGLVALLDQDLERCLDTLACPSTEVDLLSEEVGLRLLLEGRLDYAPRGRHEPFGDRQRILLGVT